MLSLDALDEPTLAGMFGLQFCGPDDPTDDYDVPWADPLRLGRATIKVEGWALASGGERSRRMDTAAQARAEVEQLAISRERFAAEVEALLIAQAKEAEESLEKAARAAEKQTRKDEREIARLEARREAKQVRDAVDQRRREESAERQREREARLQRAQDVLGDRPELMHPSRWKTYLENLEWALPKRPSPELLSRCKAHVDWPGPARRMPPELAGALLHEAGLKRGTPAMEAFFSLHGKSLRIGSSLSRYESELTTAERRAFNRALAGQDNAPLSDVKIDASEGEVAVPGDVDRPGETTKDSQSEVVAVVKPVPNSTPATSDAMRPSKALASLVAQLRITIPGHLPGWTKTVIHLNLLNTYLQLFETALRTDPEVLDQVVGEIETDEGEDLTMTFIDLEEAEHEIVPADALFALAEKLLQLQKKSQVARQLASLCIQARAAVSLAVIEAICE